MLVSSKSVSVFYPCFDHFKKQATFSTKQIKNDILTRYYYNNRKGTITLEAIDNIYKELFTSPQAKKPVDFYFKKGSNIIIETIENIITDENEIQSFGKISRAYNSEGVPIRLGTISLWVPLDLDKIYFRGYDAPPLLKNAKVDFDW